MNKAKQLTWRELKEFANQVSEEHLDSKVIWWGDGRGGVINTAEFLTENYVDFSGEGMEPESDYKGTEYENEKPDHILRKGTPILNTDF